MLVYSFGLNKDLFVVLLIKNVILRLTLYVNFRPKHS